MSNGISEHHVIISKFGEDIYVDETTHRSSYPDEVGRIQNVAVIQGNITHEELILTQDNIVELRDICEILIEKERNRIGADENWGRRTIEVDGS